MLEDGRTSLKKGSTYLKISVSILTECRHIKNEEMDLHRICLMIKQITDQVFSQVEKIKDENCLKLLFDKQKHLMKTELFITRRVNNSEAAITSLRSPRIQVLFSSLHMMWSQVNHSS